jgi:hypothetical protein
MNANEKLVLMDSILHGLGDTVNTETCIIKKLSDLESKNSTLGDRLLEQRLPEIFNLIDDALSATIGLHVEYAQVRNRFAKDNELK